MAACLGAGALPGTGQELHPQDYPVDAYAKNDKGIIVVLVRYGADGKVANCRVVRSNAPFGLEIETIDHIKKNWGTEYFAGLTINFPITFDELPEGVTKWNDDLVPPPDMLPAGNPDRSLKVRVVFRKDGWVDSTKVIESSGLQLLDVETCMWVRAHWHDDAFAGQTVDTPFVFKAPTPAKPAPKVAVAHPTPLKHKPAPVSPAPPAEPAAPPAVRVE